MSYSELPKGEVLKLRNYRHRVTEYYIRGRDKLAHGPKGILLGKVIKGPFALVPDTLKVTARNPHSPYAFQVAPIGIIYHN